MTAFLISGVHMEGLTWQRNRDICMFDSPPSPACKLLNLVLGLLQALMLALSSAEAHLVRTALDNNQIYAILCYLDKLCTIGRTSSRATNRWRSSAASTSSRSMYHRAPPVTCRLKNSHIAARLKKYLLTDALASSKHAYTRTQGGCSSL